MRAKLSSFVGMPPRGQVQASPREPVPAAPDPNDEEEDVSGSEESQSDSHSTESQSMDPETLPSFDDILPNVGTCSFFRQTWGSHVENWKVSAKTLEGLRAGFRNGSVSKLISKDCVDENNNGYDTDDAAEMVNRTAAPLRHTLNLPFCYAPGAHALRNSLLRLAYNAPTLAEDGDDEARSTKTTTDKTTIKMDKTGAARLRFANDVDVGVYASPENGTEASWHYDANHNVTVQLYGTKVWHVTPFPLAGDRNVGNSRGANDAPRNAREAADHLPTDVPCERIRVITLTPGDAVYIPPRTWHRVVPSASEAVEVLDPESSEPLMTDVCLSVDVRLARYVFPNPNPASLFAHTTLTLSFKRYARAVDVRVVVPRDDPVQTAGTRICTPDAGDVRRDGRPRAAD